MMTALFSTGLFLADARRSPRGLGPRVSPPIAPTRALLAFVLLAPALLALAPACVLADEAEAPTVERRIDDVADVPADARLALFTSQQHRDEGDPDSAIDLLLQFLEERPQQEHFLLHFHLAVSWHQRGDLEEALGSYRRAVEMEPNFAQGWLNMGELAYNMGLYGEAAEALIRGYEVSEWKEPNVLFFSAASLVMDGRSEDAIPVLEQLVGGSEQAKLEWHRALIMAYLEVDDQENGAAATDRLLKQYPEDPDAWRLAFRYFASSTLYEDAAVALTVAGYLRPLTKAEGMTLGDLYLAIGVPVTAGDYYSSAIADSGSVSDLERQASAHLAAYEYEEAFAALDAALAMEPTPRLWSLLGDLHFMQKNYRESYDSYSECVAVDPDYERAYLMMGYCAMQLERNDLAIGALEKAAEFPEQAAKANQLLAAVRYYAGQ